MCHRLLLLFLLSSVRRQNMKVRINATGDTIVMKFVRPNPEVKLEGYILGYGSSMFSKQFIQLPENGQAYETEMGRDTPTAALAPPPGAFALPTVWRESFRRLIGENSPPEYDRSVETWRDYRLRSHEAAWWRILRGKIQNVRKIWE